ncbi:MAG: AbiV family abortive infection protein [Sedimentisphaerales bacterium]|nr:AbiV family abortive infection protein [Sedimentisphaerales bacterium]
MRKKLEQYKGALTPSQITDGMNAAIRNARRLVDDAELLLNDRRYPTAASLATLSIEESGKLMVLRHLAGAKTSNEIKNRWREYRYHTKKNVMWPFSQFLSKGASKLKDFANLFDENSEHPYLLDQVKQIGFYTDCLGKAHWSEPEKVIDEKLAVQLVNTAKIFANAKEVTETEILLWIQHVSPYLDKSTADAELGLKKWYEEMQYLGLKPAGENKMTKFIDDGI